MEEFSRRRFIAYMGSAIVVTGNSSLALAQTTDEPAKTAKSTAVKYGLLHNEQRCIGCNACIGACKTTNSVPDGVTRLEILKTVDLPAEGRPGHSSNISANPVSTAKTRLASPYVRPEPHLKMR